MKKTALITNFALVLAIALAGSGCGRKYKDVANLIGGMASDSGSAAQDVPMTLLANPLASEPSASGSTREKTFSRKLKETAGGLIWLARFRAEAQALALQNEGAIQPQPQPMMASFDCTPGTLPAEDGFSCEQSCPDGQFKVSCGIPDGKSTTCDGTQYTISSGTFAFTMNFANLNTSGTGPYGTFSLGFEFGANVDGGSFDGSRLDCRISMVFDFDKIASGQGGAPTLQCGNDFSCTYDGDPVDCEDIQEEYSENPNTCS